MIFKTCFSYDKQVFLKNPSQYPNAIKIFQTFKRNNKPILARYCSNSSIVLT